MSEPEPRPPLQPLPSILGLACYKCFKEKDVHLSRCSGSCRRISYCSPECQKVDWPQHKPFCKVLSSIEKNNARAVAMLVFSLPPEPATDLNLLNDMSATHAFKMFELCQRLLGRYVCSPGFALCPDNAYGPLNLFEHELVNCEPRCMVCTRTDQLIRMEAATNGTATSEKPKQLIPCPSCNLSFCCSPAHWKLALPLHHGPCEDAHDGLSHCDMNREVRLNIKLTTQLASAQNILGEFKWAPRRLKASWSSLAGKNWEGEFGGDIRSTRLPDGHPVSSWVRAASEDLTMSMTILYALEELNDDDAWTRKHTLDIHIIGATRLEVSATKVFEEIFHRLPQVKTLKFLLCGPDMPTNVPRLQPIKNCLSAPPPTVRPTSHSSLSCRDCNNLGRKRVHENVVGTYHSYVQKEGSKFEVPDLAIAFNSGASQSSMHSWPPTFKILLERKVPSLFTSYNRYEGEGEAALLRKAGATLLPSLGPVKNPWGSIKMVAESNRVYGFDAMSGWLAGGFK
ncbi:hypothetical protein C8R46DRAFT_929313 [Mycena filopes]|nr:hypothetical protein C8R46DRAFT_929313 [Mycena filopes]